MTPWERLWNRLTIEERRQASREVIVQSAKVPEASESILQVLAENTKYRPDVVARWSSEKQADYLSRARMIDGSYGSFVTTFFVKYRQPMLARMLDVAEIPNVNGCIDMRTQPGPIAMERLAAGIRVIDREFPVRDVSLYLDAIEAQDQPMWRHLAEAKVVARKTAPASTSAAVAPTSAPAPANAVEPVRTSVVVPQVPPPPPPPPALRLLAPPPLPASRFVADPPIDRGEVHLADVERLSPLDTFVRDRLIATAAGTTGAPTGDRMRSVVEELIQLNETRHRSWFHLGFLDVCERREPDLDVARNSERDRGWYLAGAIAGHARSGDGAAIVAMFDRHRAEARRVLGDRHEATSEAAGALVEAMCEAGRSEEAVAALAPTAVSKGGERVYDALIAEAGARLAASKESSAVLKLLSDAIEAGLRRQDRTRPGLADEVAVLRATAYRVNGNFDLAAELLEGIDARGDEALVARAEGERGLVACRDRSLSEVRLPMVATDLPATAARLEPGIVYFERASVRANPRRFEADFVVGIYPTFRGCPDRFQTTLSKAADGMRSSRRICRWIAERSGSNVSRNRSFS